MATTNPFDLLVDDDNDDPNQLLAKLPPAAKKSPAPAAQAEPAKPAAKLPSKPLPPAQAGKCSGFSLFCLYVRKISLKVIEVEI